MPPRRIGLNALFLDPEISGGPETYLRGLVPALRGLHPDVRFSVVTTRRGAPSLRAAGWPDVVALPVDEGQRARRLAAEQIALPALTRAYHFDVLHSLASVAPVACPVPHVVTVHDVTFMHEATFGWSTTMALRRIVGTAARRADALITGTAAARDDVCRTLGLDSSRFTVVHHGPGRSPGSERTAEDDIRDRYDLPGGALVVLCVGAKRPHKNQELVLRALPLLPKDSIVVLTGRPEPYESRLRQLAAELEVVARVRFVDYASDADLEALWGLCSVAAFPTRGEGFGLPVVEALARGVAVACSDLPVLREVGGPYVRTFPVDDPEECARALLSGASGDFDAEGARRWATNFSWEAAARATFAVYEQVVACTSA